MSPGSLFHYIESLLHHISFPSTCQFLSPFPYFAIFYFLFHKPKIPKIFTLPFIYLYQISLLQVTMKGLTTPLSRWVQVVGCLCRYSVTCALSPTGLIPWFSKLREILMLLCCVTLSSSRENQRSAQEVAAGQPKCFE